MVAALLRDIGWLVPPASEAHETCGAAYLAARFAPSVTEPVRLHVAARRYLCSVDDVYHQALSDASKRTLVHQDGLLDRYGIESFEGEEFARDAARLHRYDDRAKIAGRATPDLASFVTIVEGVICQ